MILREEHLESAAVLLALLGLGILYVTLTFTNSQGFGKIQSDNVYITGHIGEGTKVESGWIHSMTACEDITVWTEDETNNTGVVNITGSKEGDFFIAEDIKKTTS